MREGPKNLYENGSYWDLKNPIEKLWGFSINRLL